MSNIGIEKNNYKKILVDTIPKQKPPKNTFFGGLCWSGQQDSNLRPSAPKADTLTGLRYAPN